MAAASSTFSGTVASRPSVLLLEEYDALAAAIGSALKKFAPHHAVSVARSLADAEKLASETNPELFVLDVDPPWTGLTDFLERMRTALPNARALVIGTPIPAEIAAERGLFGALQFIEKPFELAKFGASVQALLGPWRESESTGPRGTLRSFGAADVVLIHCAATATVIVDVSANAKDFGEIHFVRGELVHAETRKLTGADALREILSWTDARMREAKESPSAKRTIPRGWSDVLVEVLRATKPTEPVRISPADEPPAKRSVKSGKKIVIVDDTEMLLIFAEDILTTGDPELQITTAASGGDGVKKIEAILPDLVLLDYSLPDFNGDEVCARLLQNERTANIPILMMSGHVLEMNSTAARFENVVATIEKPFLSDALVDLVRKTLQGERQPRPKIAEPVPAPKVSAPIPPPVVETKPAPPIAKPPPAPPIIKQVPRTLPRVEVAATAVPVIAMAERDAVLGLFLEVLSMQLTPELQMGAIRAKPASMTVSLQLPPSARNAVPSEIGFQLGTTALDGNGRISTLCLIPTAKPFQPSPTQSAFEIGGVSVIPSPARARVQLTPSGTTPMTIELIANLEIAAVELSSSFQVGRLVLKWRPNSVRVTLNPKAPPQSAARFDATAVKLDNSARIAELLLSPVR